MVRTTQAVTRGIKSEVREDKLLGGIDRLSQAVGSCEKVGGATAGS